MQQNDVSVRVIDRKRRFFYMRAELPDGSRQERSTGIRNGGKKQRRTRRCRVGGGTTRRQVQEPVEGDVGRIHGTLRP